MGGGGGMGRFAGTRGSGVEIATLEPLSGDRLLNMGAFALIDIDGNQVTVITRPPGGPTTARNLDKWQSLLERDGLTIVGAGISAAKLLPLFAGSTPDKIVKTLEKHGFTLEKHEASFNKSCYIHPDGSRVLIHPYGNPNRGLSKAKSNAHAHKIAPEKADLNDRGNPVDKSKQKSTLSAERRMNENHIGIKNPQNFTAKTGKAHGHGKEPPKPSPSSLGSKGGSTGKSNSGSKSGGMKGSGIKGGGTPKAGGSGGGHPLMDFRDLIDGSFWD